MASQMVIPVFHRGDLSPGLLSSKQYKLSDSIADIVNGKWLESVGSGLFYSQNLGDLLMADESDKLSKRYYAYDLAQASNLFKLTDPEDISELQDISEKMNNYVLLKSGIIKKDDELFADA